MVEQELISAIQALVRPLLDDEGVDLVEIQVTGGRGARGVRIFIDRPGGVTIEDCAHVSREVMDLLDMEYLIEGNYRLEVSSPGVDRPLRTPRDFMRAIGRKVRVRLHNGVKRSPVVVGRLIEMVEESLVMDTPKERITLPLNEVKEGKMEVEF